MLKSEQKSSEKTGDEAKFKDVCDLVAIGVPVTKACEREGLDRNRYYYLLRTSQSAHTQEAS